MVKVSVTESAGFSFRTTIDGKVLKLKLAEPVDVTVRSSLARLSDRNLVFVFEESDREELMAITEGVLEMVSLELGKPISSKEELAEMLLPIVKKKTTAAKKKTTPKEKTTSKAAKSSLAKK